MKTAVPGTRGGFFRATSEMNKSIGREPAWRMRVSIVRPVFHVLITVKTTIAIMIVTQPPLASLIAFAANRARSVARKIVRNAAINHIGHLHFDRATTAYNTVVIAKAPVTAMP